MPNGSSEEESPRPKREQPGDLVGALNLRVQDLEDQLREAETKRARELVQEREERLREREEFREQLAMMSEAMKASQLGMYGLAGLEHPEVDEGLSQQEQLKTLEEEYRAIVDTEADKMERKKPLPYDSWRTLLVIDFIEGVATRKEHGQIGKDEMEELTERLLGHLTMREAIWDRICWHEQSEGWADAITSVRGPRPAAEQLREFESLPETRVAIEVINQYAETFVFGDEYPLPDKRGKPSTYYAEMQMHSGTRKDFYRQMVDQLRKKLEDQGIKVNRRKATRILEKTEDYLRMMGWISMLDPNMIWNVNDQLRDAFYGLTRNLNRAKSGKPGGTIYGAGLFMAREGVKEKVHKDLGEIDPIITVPKDRVGEGELSGSFYHVTTVKGRISADGRSFVLFRPEPEGLAVEAGICADCKMKELEIPIEEVMIGGRPLKEGVVEVQKFERKKSAEKNEPLNHLINVRLIDLMDGGKKPLKREVWDYIEDGAYDGMLLFWAMCLRQNGDFKGVYGRLLKTEWKLEEFDIALNLIMEGHLWNYVMNTSPLLNVVDDDVVRINGEGKIVFGDEEGGMTKSEVRDMFRARYIANAASTLSPLAVKYKHLPEKASKRETWNLDVQDATHIEDVCFEEVMVADKVVARPFIKNERAQADLKERLSDLISEKAVRRAIKKTFQRK